MKEMLSKIIMVFVWVCLGVAFSSIGLASEIPFVMVPILALVYIATVGLIVLHLSKNKRQSYENIKTPKYLYPAIGTAILIFSIFFPMLSISNYRPELIANGILIVFTIIITLLCMGEIYLINVMGQKKNLFKILGFALLIITVAIPALFIAPIDPSFGTLGTIYFTMMLNAVIVWAGFSMFYKIFSILKND